ncbi:hypothetical protein KCP76_12540 [Salmonella enterica subsp. enterica serovar Weltevreden]|nr:hypothetical protein KCP76_12540 [Salmonella enterica subsp. enterica serovar Weltevreden]
MVLRGRLTQTRVLACLTGCCRGKRAGGGGQVGSLPGDPPACSGQSRGENDTTSKVRLPRGVGYEVNAALAKPAQGAGARGVPAGGRRSVHDAAPELVTLVQMG